ncbi:hypothetical protein F5880DRAFT_947880 [Lentinula raphanica]|nr:hypothetical protein F5880DRAFT_947880 [Lentinula raphanica]
MPDSLPIPTNMPTTLTGSVAGPSSLNKDKENEKEKDKGHAILRRRRPSPPPRQPSYSKRHASFDSPREVPLPSPSLQAQSGQAEFSYFDVPLKTPRSPRKAGTTQQAHPLTRDKEKDFFSPVFEDIEGSEWTSVDKPPSPALSLSQNSNSQKQSALNPPTSGPSSHLYETYSTLGMLPANSQQIHPFPRPYSLPHSSSSGSSGSVICPEGDSNDETGGPSRLGRSKTEEGLDIYSRDQIGLGTSGWDSFGNVDRASSASLPLPSQIPYHALPRVGEHHKLDFGRLRGLVGEVARSKVPEVSVDEGGKSQPELVTVTSSNRRCSFFQIPAALLIWSAT